MRPRRFKDRESWRGWLEANHAKASEAWLLFFKKHVNARALEYGDAVEEAICWGWIDGKLRSIDDRTHMIRFTPRKPGSIWSLTNRRRAERMIREGRMTEHGMACVKIAKKNGQWAAAYDLATNPKVPADLEKALRVAGRAWTNYSALSNTHKAAFVFRVSSAKREETRRRRIEEAVRLTSQGETLQSWFQKRLKTSR